MEREPAKARGRGGKKLEAKTSKAKATAKPGPKGKAKAKAKAKSKATGTTAGPSKQGETPPSTPSKPAAAGHLQSPLPPGSEGKMMSSARRHAQDRRKRIAAEALAYLRSAGIPGLSLPPQGFKRQSYTVYATSEMVMARSSIGVILKSREFRIPTPKIPDDLQKYAHTDGQNGCTIGWGSYPSVLVAPLDCNSLSGL